MSEHNKVTYQCYDNISSKRSSNTEVNDAFQADTTFV